MDGPFFLKARSNISLDGDLYLAGLEVERFFAESMSVDRHVDLSPHLLLPSRYVNANTRARSPIGFVARGLKTSLQELISSLCFVQEVWMPCKGDRSATMEKAVWWNTIATEEGSFACAIPLMAAGEYLTYMQKHRVSTDDLSALTGLLCSPLNGGTPYAAAIRRVNTANPHVHGLHKYKAKFFPRLVRHLIVTHLPRAPRGRDGRRVVLDPFVGSGTSVVEAGLLGIPSIGVDIDRLSCRISSAKIFLASAEPSFVDEEIGRIADAFEKQEKAPVTGDRYAFPPWIARKFERNGTTEAMNRYEEEITRWIGVIEQIQQDDIRETAEVCFSDALSRKFNIRMMGTGVGRFALEIRTAKITSLMRANLCRAARMSRVTSTLIDAYQVHVEPPLILHADAKKIPIPGTSVSMVITSPPYLPASSGREDYLVGKSIAITALGLMHPAAIESSEIQSIGSMKANGPVQIDRLPSEARNLYWWLKGDELRSIKADPVARYYTDLRNALLETYRVLMPGGLAIYIIGKESVFYTYKDRKILYTVPCDLIFHEIATDSGFTVERTIDLELDKKQGNARPRSTDDYFESICILRKPA